MFFVKLEIHISDTYYANTLFHLLQEILDPEFNYTKMPHVLSTLWQSMIACINTMSGHHCLLVTLKYKIHFVFDVLCHRPPIACVCCAKKYFCFMTGEKVG